MGKKILVIQPGAAQNKNSGAQSFPADQRRQSD